jgi:hypothetical protein
MTIHHKTRVRLDRTDNGWEEFRRQSVRPHEPSSLDARDAWLAYIGCMGRLGQEGARVHRMPRHEFTRRLLADGWEMARSNGRTVWRGLTLSPAGLRDRDEGRTEAALAAETDRAGKWLRRNTRKDAEGRILRDDMMARWMAYIGPDYTEDDHKPMLSSALREAGCIPGKTDDGTPYIAGRRWKN